MWDGEEGDFKTQLWRWERYSHKPRNTGSPPNPQDGGGKERNLPRAPRGSTTQQIPHCPPRFSTSDLQNCERVCIVSNQVCGLLTAAIETLLLQEWRGRGEWGDTNCLKSSYGQSETQPLSHEPVQAGRGWDLSALWPASDCLMVPPIGWVQ